MASGQLSQAKPNKSSWRQAKKKIVNAVKPTEVDVFWHPSMSTPPPRNYTPGLIPILKSALIESHSRGDIRKAVLCWDKTVYIQSMAWNASWGCGYRNFLMICAALMSQEVQPFYFPLIDEPIPPSIRGLQQWIEIAWDDGFDLEGKLQLKKLSGTNKWIGTADIWVAFSSRRIPAELVDFDVTKPSGVQPLIDWTIRYFTPKLKRNEGPQSAFDALKSSNSVVVTDMLPFILQHSGHSRLIVGYEITKQGKVNLLTFDSSHILSPTLRDQALAGLSGGDSSHPSSSQQGVKRPARESFGDATNIKRQCKSSERDPAESIEIMGERNMKENLDDEIVITGYTSPDKKATTSTSSRVAENDKTKVKVKVNLTPFRLSSEKLSKQRQYQILYFPLTDPLTEDERLRRRTPRSTKVS